MEIQRRDNMKNFRITVIDTANGARQCQGDGVTISAGSALSAIMRMLVSLEYYTPMASRFTGTRNYGEYRTNDCLVRATPVR